MTSLSEMEDPERAPKDNLKKKRKRRSVGGSSGDSDTDNVKFWKKAFEHMKEKYNELLKQVMMQNASGSKSIEESSVNNDENSNSGSSNEEMSVNEDEETESEVDDEKKSKNVNSKYEPIVNKIKKTSSINIKKSAQVSAQNKTKNNNNKSDQQVKNNKPAPIYLREKPNKNLMEFIIKIVGAGKFYTSFQNSDPPETKIQLNTEDDYRKLTKELTANKYYFYTFRLKSDRGISAVIRGIEPEVDVEDIKEALKENKFNVKHIHNICNKQKIPLPLHLVELQPEATKIQKGGVHPIFELQFLMHRKIRVEEPRPKMGPVQCHNCQEFGHTKTYCQLPSVCVICGDNHLSHECDKEKKENSSKFCKNCAGNHTANYRGCIVYQHIKNKMNPKIVKQPQPTGRNSVANVPSQITKGLTYAKVASASSPIKNKIDETEILPLLSNLMQTMQQLIQDQARIFNLINSKNEQ